MISASLTFETLIDAIDMADDGIDNDSSGYTFIDNTFITDQASGGQPGGNIRTGFLYREDRVTLVENSVQTISGQASGEAFEGARLPLVATFEFNGEEITVVNNHFSSKGGSAPVFGVEQDFAARQEDVTVNGSLDERQRQSEAVQDFVTGLLTVDAEANVVVLGDFNEFEFVSPVLELETEAGLNNLTNTLDPNERYTFNFQGNSQSLDHILVSDALFADAQFDIVHVNSEFAETEQRASDHDPLVALFSLGPPPPELATVAVDFEGRGLFGSGFVESVDDGIVDSGRLPIASNTAFFDDVDVAVDAAAPGFELLTFVGGSLGVYSIGDRFFRGEATLVNDSETLIFDMEEGAFGDALVAMFEFATVFGNGDVEVAFFDDGTFLGNETFNAYSGPVSADFDGQRFDAVEISAVGDTAFSLSSFAFDRETFDGFDIV